MNFKGKNNKMNKYHHVKILRFTKKHLIIEIDGEEKTFNLNKLSKALKNASDVEKTTYTVSPSGDGIHWPLLDEDISIDGLSRNIQRLHPDIKKPLKPTFKALFRGCSTLDIGVGTVVMDGFKIFNTH